MTALRRASRSWLAHGQLSVQAAPVLTQVIPAAGFFLFRRDSNGVRWLLLRNRKRGDWGFPKGHGEAGEDALCTALRECVEETGIAVVAVRSSALVLRYTVRRGLKEVSYFLAETNQHSVTLSAEHDRAEWVEGKRVLRLLGHESLRQIFREAEATLCVQQPSSASAR